jgi:hypothetical protein
MRPASVARSLWTGARRWTSGQAARGLLFHVIVSASLVGLAHLPTAARRFAPPCPQALLRLILFSLFGARERCCTTAPMRLQTGQGEEVESCNGSALRASSRMRRTSRDGVSSGEMLSASVHDGRHTQRGRRGVSRPLVFRQRVEAVSQVSACQREDRHADSDRAWSAVNETDVLLTIATRRQRDDDLLTSACNDIHCMT